jgi:membrane protease YdiL (CAAX protease family)
VGLGLPVVVGAAATELVRWLELPPELLRSVRELAERIQKDLSMPVALVTIALLPAICEEALFRGWLLSALRRRLNPIATCAVVGVIFGLFHLDLLRVGTTALIGVALAYARLRSASILPCVVIHALNNGAAVVIAKFAPAEPELPLESVPWPLLAPAMLMVAAGLWLLGKSSPPAMVDEPRARA